MKVKGVLDFNADAKTLGRRPLQRMWIYGNRRETSWTTDKWLSISINEDTWYFDTVDSPEEQDLHVEC